MTLSLLGKFDEYNRKAVFFVESDTTKAFLTFVRHQRQCQLKWKESVDECQRLKNSLDKSETQISDMEKKLTRARMILHEEKERANAAEAAKDAMEERLAKMLRVLESVLHAGGQLANDTKEQLDQLMTTSNGKLRYSGIGCSESLYPRLDPIDEINSTGDLLSDISVSRSEDTVSLDTSDRMTRIKKPRRSDVVLDELPNKRRRSARLSACGLKTSGREQLIATTTVAIPPGGTVTAKSRIETRLVDGSETFQIPATPQFPASSSDSEAPTPRVNHFTRPHYFEKATVLKPEECCGCSKNMNFASKMLKCGECKAVAHPECRDGVPIPCMPTVATPRGERTLRLVDLVGPALPLVPPIIVRCGMEIERRGLTELGLYRVPGSEKEVRALRTKFQRGKSTISLASYDIHVVCGVLKDFLRSLPEPVITLAQWSAFTAAVQENNQDRAVALYQQIAELPPAHRDTLAFIMMHLLRVAQSPPCKMTVTNLATVFGPTLVGYSSAAPTNTELCDQTPLQAMVVESLLDLGEDYWKNVMQKPSIWRTPLLTPKYSMRRRNVGKTSKLFNTPPAK